MELTYGRPAVLSGRDDAEIRVYELLDQLGVEYWVVDHPAVMTMEDCEAIDQVLDAVVCKNLLLCTRKKTEFYLLMIPASKRFKTAAVSKLIGTSRLSFAPEEDMQALLDLTPGSVSVMGLMNDKEGRVQLLMDEELLESEYFGCHPCRNTSSMKLKVRDLTEKILPRIAHQPIYLHIGEEND